jgi:hypothetical protein
MHISANPYKPGFDMHLEVVKFEVAYFSIRDTYAVLNFTMVANIFTAYFHFHLFELKICDLLLGNFERCI